MAFGIKHSLLALAGVVVVSGGAWWYQKQGVTTSGKEGAPTAATPGGPAGPRAASVETGVVEVMSLQDDALAVGTLRSRQSVMMRPEVAGRVAALGFSDGARVKAGQVLVQLDDSLQRAEIKQSLAQVSIAKANLKRNQELVAQNFVAQRVVDENLASLEVAQAQLALSCARLGRMAVVAPFDGTVGLRVVNKGDYVKDGADLVNLEDISSMYVDYRLPERLAGKVKLGQTLVLQLDAFPGRQFNAKIEAIDPLLDVNGRSVGIRAVLPNTPGEPMAVAGAKPGASAKLPQTKPSSKEPTASPGKGPKPQAEASSLVPLTPLKDVFAQVGCSPIEGPTAGARATAKPEVTAATGAASSARSAGAARPNTGPAPMPLRPGMFARVNTVFAVRDKALAIAEEAVVPQGGRQFVVRVVKAAELPVQPAAAASTSAGASQAPALAPDTLVSMRQEVKLGVRKQGKVEVLEGLQEGQVIVLAGHQRLQRDGTPVKVVEMGRPGGPPAGAASAASASAPAGAASR